MKLQKVKVRCHACRSAGVIEDEEYETGRVIKLVCPECEGEGFVWDEEVKSE
jgi:DnaJ-class molecular chaperone